MEIKVERIRQTTVNDVPVGELFAILDKFTDSITNNVTVKDKVLMKVMGCAKNSLDYNAVNLHSGSLYILDKDTPVIILKDSNLNIRY